MKESRKEKQVVTRARIKQAACAALEENGSSGFQIEQITRQAGFTRGAFYANFDSKADLLLEILRDRVSEELRFWNAVFQHANDAATCLASVVFDSQESSRAQAALKAELQLEAERNQRFREHYCVYLELVHAELKELLVTILSGHGKDIPDDLDLKVAGVYALGSSLGLRSSLGFRNDHQAAAFHLMLDYIRGVIEASPSLLHGESDQTHSAPPAKLGKRQTSRVNSTGNWSKA